LTAKDLDNYFDDWITVINVKNFDYKWLDENIGIGQYLPTKHRKMIQFRSEDDALHFILKFGGNIK
jgi:hypothetical protein